MREKSSSELTSFSSRSALRCATVTSSRLARRLFAVPQHVLERTQHQRQRRAEFVADVGEKGRLGAVDLGQRLGAAALLLVRLRVGDAAAIWPATRLRKPDSCRRTGGTG